MLTGAVAQLDDSDEDMDDAESSEDEKPVKGKASERAKGLSGDTESEGACPFFGCSCLVPRGCCSHLHLARVPPCMLMSVYFV